MQHGIHVRDGGVGVFWGAGGSSDCGDSVGELNGCVIASSIALDTVREDGRVNELAMDEVLSNNMGIVGTMVSALEHDTKRLFIWGCFHQARMDDGV